MKKRIDTFWRYRNLLFELVKKGIKLKYRRSYLGIIWSLLEPVMTTIVLTIVFGTLYGNKDHTFHCIFYRDVFFIPILHRARKCH